MDIIDRLADLIAEPTAETCNLAIDEREVIDAITEAIAIIKTARDTVTRLEDKLAGARRYAKALEDSLNSSLRPPYPPPISTPPR